MSDARATPWLTTGRLVLRPRRVEDAEALFPALSDAEAMRYWSGPPHASVEETRANFAAVHPGWRCWSITRQGADAAIGFVSVGEKWQGGVSEIGYLLARNEWGGGIAREAVSAVIDRLFAEGQRRVFADTDPDNAASRGLLERLGFRLEGILRAEWETHIGVRDTALYGLLASDWSARAADQVERAGDEIFER